MKSAVKLVVLCVLVAMVLSGCFGGPSGNDEPQEDGTTESVDPEVKEMRDAIATSLTTGEPLVIDAYPVEGGGIAIGGVDRLGDPVEFGIVLSPGEILNNETWAEIGGENVELPGIESYEGHVIDHPNWPVRLTVTDEWARGFILTSDENQGSRAHLIRVNLDGNFPKDVPGLPSRPPGSGLEVPSTFLDEGSGEDCLSPAPYPITPILGDPADLDPISVRVILDGDPEFFEAMEDHTFPMMIAMIQEVDAIYERETNIRITVEGLHVHKEGTFVISGGIAAPLTELADYWNERPGLERDLVHLFSGIDGEGLGGGVANCNGSAGIPEAAYSYSLFYAENTTVNRHTKIVAHEIGHLFNAHHHYANKISMEDEVAATLMDEGALRLVPTFSPLSQAVARGWAEEHL